MYREVADNKQAFGDWVKRAEDQQLILAFENLNGEQETTDIDVLCDLVDSFHSTSAKVCYDTGHAHMCGHVLGRDILRLGNRLVATHIADNHGREDEHLLPFYGTIDGDACSSPVISPTH